MVFNSGAFLAFFILFFPLYWLVSNKGNLNLRNALILAASYLFYGWWDWRFLGLLFFSSSMDYIIGLQLEQTASKRKLWLYFSILINLSLLGFFKYYNFFAESLAVVLQTLHIPFSFSVLKIILPVGISFYTFQSLSYTIEIYRGKLKATQNYLTLLTYVSFFPQLVAGPIERASHLLPQFNTIKKFNYTRSVEGLQLIVWGLFKKIVIADNLGLISDIVFKEGTNYNSLTILAGAFAFTFQIYADFSGYSDIAIGVSRMMGFDLMKNFNSPYFSSSLTDFWHRWHISLSTWFRDYLFIPLGGSKKGGFKTYGNILTTFLVSGLWHGANFTFILWGFLHGLVICIEKALGFTKSNKWKIPIILFIVCLLWIPFRVNNWSHFVQVCKQLSNLTFTTTEFKNILSTCFPFVKFWLLLISFIVFMVFDYLLASVDIHNLLYKYNKGFRYTFYYTLLLLIFILSNLNVKPYFIYFQF